MSIPAVPINPEERCPVVRAAEQLRSVGAEPVLVEPDSPAQGLPHDAYYVPAGYFQPGAPAVVVVREDPEDDGAAQAAALFRGAAYHATVRLGLAPPHRIVACDAAAEPCSPGDERLLRREVASWWSWWAPRAGRRPAMPVR